MLPVAVDAMGGDHAPGPILAGAHLAASRGIPVVLVGPADLDGREGPDGSVLDLIEASEVIGMHDDPAQGVRRKKDSSLVRAAEAVRDGRGQRDLRDEEQARPAGRQRGGHRLDVDRRLAAAGDAVEQDRRGVANLDRAEHQ